MSIFVSGIRLPFGEPEQAALQAACRQCGIALDRVDAAVYRISLDARHGRIQQVYTVVLDGLEEEEAFAAKLQMPSVRYKKTVPFAPALGKKTLSHPPVVVGFGPAGLFAAFLLARYGYQPLVLERGDAIALRDQAVNKFWAGGALDLHSNIQFGEGGAGAYSDGKLTTRINDPLCDEVLRILAQFGAPPEILRMAKPHIGTDILKTVVCAMREAIIAYGGTVRFRTPVTGLSQNRLCLPLGTAHGILFLTCIKQVLRWNLSHFQQVCALNICKRISTALYTAKRQGCQGCRLRNMPCPAGTADGLAIPFVCAPVARLLRHKARKIPL